MIEVGLELSELLVHWAEVALGFEAALDKDLLSSLSPLNLCSRRSKFRNKSFEQKLDTWFLNSDHRNMKLLYKTVFFSVIYGDTFGVVLLG